MVLRTKGKRPKLKRPPKYGNRKVRADGLVFDSEREWQRYTELVLALKSGLITQLQVHPKFELSVNGEKVCDYVADFSYRIYGLKGNDLKDGQKLTWDGTAGFYLFVVEDSKGVRTKDYIIKRKLMKAVHGIQVREI